MAAAGDQTHFGQRTVRLDQKQSLVNDVFHSVATRYDLMNDLMSFGLHRASKALYVAKVRPPLTRPFHHIDVAGGTGDVATRVAKAGGPSTEVTVVDVNPDMLRVGEKRAARRAFSDRLTFFEGDAEALPPPDARFDTYESRSASAMCRASKPLSGKLIVFSSAADVPVPRIFARRFACHGSLVRRLFLRRPSR